MTDWYKRTMDEIAAWWANFDLRRFEFEAKYQVLATEKPKLQAIAAWVAYWVDTRHTFDDMSKQLSTYFTTISGNDSELDPPAPIIWTLPPGQPAEVLPGIAKFIRDIRREVVGLTNYAQADGEALGFESTASLPVSPTLVKPEIQVFAAANNHHFTCVVIGRADSDMSELWIQRKGANWTLHGTFTGKSIDASVALTVPAEPEQILARVQLRRKNTDYGQPSDPAYVTLNP